MPYNDLKKCVRKRTPSLWWKTDWIPWVTMTLIYPKTRKRKRICGSIYANMEGFNIRKNNIRTSGNRSSIHRIPRKLIHGLIKRRTKNSSEGIRFWNINCFLHSSPKALIFQESEITEHAFNVVVDGASVKS